LEDLYSVVYGLKSFGCFEGHGELDMVENLLRMFPEGVSDGAERFNKID
jgi:hypothetical protein